MKSLLQPVVILLLWSMIIWAWLYVTRIPAMRRAGIDMIQRTGGTGRQLDGVIPDRVQWKAHNYNHLMEQPTLFYAVVFVSIWLEMTDGMTIALAWAYVLTRIAHSLVQVLWNRIIVRFTLFVLASLALFALVVRATLAAFA